MLREGGRLQQLDGVEFVEITSEEEPVDAQQLHLAVECLHRLGDPCRKLLEEFYYHQSSMNKIVEKLGYKNEDAAKSQKYKCQARLRKLFNNKEITNLN